MTIRPIDLGVTDKPTRLVPPAVDKELAGYTVVSFALAERCLGTYVSGGTTFDAEIELPQHGASRSQSPMGGPPSKAL